MNKMASALLVTGAAVLVAVTVRAQQPPPEPASLERAFKEESFYTSPIWYTP